ncbi:alpha/beta hydrolase family protein [Botrimarina hoheduenensis]|uniref:Alpha/beta hydrolase family protein n=1 Tax=Botrimarina hoheduenensis TaxID=2528000 RepID=A0A5C5VRV6_9BACT|nr:alpha/beta hydrolase [Botrimarina hoheduenensis]TWT41328.1 Alpha/beta hydrolase family protein [Botrimarina hoheduenensis]
MKGLSDAGPPGLVPADSSPTRDWWRLAVGLGVAVGASIVASGVQSSWGRVSVRSLTIPTENGQWVVADLFKPSSATKENPAPLVVVVPGFQRSKETLSNLSIELSRRGVVVIAIDPYAQGASSSSLSRRAATTEGYGMFAVVHYAHDTPNLNYVDKRRIAATGHSAGGNAAIRGANYFGRLAAKQGKPCKLQSVFVSGYVLTLTERVLKPVRCNMGASYAFYDEGAYRNELGDGDMRRAPEALRLINSALPDGGRVKEVEIGRYYGDAADGTLRVMHNERLIHPFQPYDVGATANQLAYFERVFDLTPSLLPRDQVWWWKELMTLIAAVAAFSTLVPLARLLLRTPFFGSLVRPCPPPSPRPGGAGRSVFWGVLALSAAVACFSYIPLAYWSQSLFAAASDREATWFFPQRMNNAVMLWAVLNGVFGFMAMLLTHRWFGHHRGARVATWGAGTTFAELGKSLTLATCLFAFFFAQLFAIYYFLHVDYRFVFFGARVFQPVMFLLLAMYAPIFFVFFLSNSLRVNGAMRFEGESEWRSTLLAGVANSLGLFSILAIQYTVFAATGTVFWRDGWLYVNLLFAVAPIMFVLPFFHRWFFRMTGRIYLGPMTTCLIFVMILLSNTVCYTPL